MSIYASSDHVPLALGKAIIIEAARLAPDGLAPMRE